MMKVEPHGLKFVAPSASPVGRNPERAIASRRIGILSLGCPRNVVDAESILGRLKHKGYTITEIENADVALVTTCAFIDEATRESVDAILDLVRLKKEGTLKKIIVHGCLPQRFRDQLRVELPEIDAFVGTLSLANDPRRFPLTARHYAYLKIAEGCVNACSYCVIPAIKGALVSLDERSVLERAAALDNEGISELNIIGQDITGYGIDRRGASRLDALISRLARRARGIGWIRLLYLHPRRVTDELIGVIRDTPKVCKYVDLPVQHINDRILKLMNRRTTKRQIMKLIEKIRKEIPGVALRTSLITGFPSETDEEFRELLSFVKEARFERLGAFMYSREEGTPAYGFAGQVPDKIRQARFDELMSCQQSVSAEVNRGFLGRTIEVLIEERGDGCYLGRSRFDAPEVDGLVYVKSARVLKPGEFVNVHITDTMEYDLSGAATG